MKLNNNLLNIKNTHSTSETDVYSCNYVNGLNSYSTTEQRVGTWIDGKPLYRIVLNVTNVSNDLTYLNIDEWVDIKIMARMTNGVIFNIGRYENNSDLFSYYIYDNNKSVNINIGNNWTLSKANITLLYTKTTD